MAKRLTLLGVVIATCIHVPPSAGEALPKTIYRISEIAWGDAVDGHLEPEWKPEDIKGRLLVVEEFGVKIPACVDRLKELARLEKRLARENSRARIIAIHRQREVPDAEIVKSLRKQRVEFSVRKNGFLPASIGGMPHVAIFMPDGVLHWHGDPQGRDFERELKVALEKVRKMNPTP